MHEIICRKQEQQELEAAFNTKNAEFILIYGRRRIGKSFLIKEFFKKKRCIFFYITGIQDGLLDEQLAEFAKAIGDCFYQGATIATPTSWMAAFSELTKAIHAVEKNKKIILFFDEFPWMATKKSRLIQALDYYWNRHWVDHAKVKLIICGSSASWLIKNILYNKGGLHNRTTKKLILKPFNVSETKIFLESKGIKLNQDQIVELYMAVGGIPHYLNHIKKGQSASQNINTLYFKNTGVLFDEFEKLFSSLFEEKDIYLDIIKTIAKSRYGIARTELEKMVKKKHKASGGRLTERLNDLETAGFISAFLPLSHNRQGLYYRIIDEFCYFYLKWVVPEKQTLLAHEAEHNYWLIKSRSASYQSWAGYAFEALCYKHIAAIRKALNILADARVGVWRHVPKKAQKDSGAQIDLLFDKSDGSIVICEIKYTEKPFIIDKEYYHQLLEKIKIYQRVSKTNKQIFVSVISAHGLKASIYSEELISAIVTLDDLF